MVFGELFNIDQPAKQKSLVVKPVLVQNPDRNIGVLLFGGKSLLIIYRIIYLAAT
jgi:hypothetical protein